MEHTQHISKIDFLIYYRFLSTKYGHFPIHNDFCNYKFKGSTKLPTSTLSNNILISTNLNTNTTLLYYIQNNFSLYMYTHYHKRIMNINSLFNCRYKNYLHINIYSYSINNAQITTTYSLTHLQYLIFGYKFNIQLNI